MPKHRARQALKKETKTQILNTLKDPRQKNNIQTDVNVLSRTFELLRSKETAEMFRKMGIFDAIFFGKARRRTGNYCLPLTNDLKKIADSFHHFCHFHVF